MLDWLFEPIFKAETCVGPEVGNVTCHTEPFGLTPIILITIGAFIGVLGIASLINKWKEDKLEEKV